MRTIILIAGILFLTPLLSAAQDGNAQKMEVMMKMLSLKNSLIAKDSVTLSGLLASDVTYGHTNGLIQTKGQLIHSVMSGEQDYKSIEPSDMDIRLYDNTGVVTMKSKVMLNFNGQPLDLNMYVTLVWVHKNNNWTLVARQAVKL